MKKLAILILMTTVISFMYSCQNQNVAELKAKQAAAIDQEVSNRLGPIREDLLSVCDTRVDSMILAQAEEIASAEGEQKTIAPPKPKSSGKTSTPPPPAPPAPKASTTKNTSTDKKKSKIKGAIEKVIKPSDTAKKKAKMKGEKVPVTTEDTNKKKSKMKGKKKE